MGVMVYKQVRGLTWPYNQIYTFFVEVAYITMAQITLVEESPLLGPRMEQGNSFHLLGDMASRM